MRITAESATGLNELPDEAHASRRDKIAAWRDWLAIQVRYGRRAIISCRTADYIQELDAVRDREVPHLELQTLDLPKIREFLENRSRLDARQADEAVRRIEADDLERLYNTPLMLTLLEEVLQSASAFPRGRAELFSRYLCRLVIRERQNPRGGELIDALFDPEDLRDMADPRQPLLPPDAPFFTALARLAYDGQRREFKGEPQEVNFARRAIREALDNDQWTLARALHLLIEAETRGQYRFRHQQFQEYFAAQELARSGEVALAQAPWRSEDKFQRRLAEVREDKLSTLGEFPPVDRSGWEETARMAAELAEDGDDFIARLAEVNLPLAGQSAAPARIALNFRADLAERLCARMRDGCCRLLMCLVNHRKPILVDLAPKLLPATS